MSIFRKEWEEFAGWFDKINFMRRFFGLFLAFVLPACGSVPVSPDSTSTLPPPNVMVETITPSPRPVMTTTSSVTPTGEELIFPYTIDGLRQHEYQGGDIHIREELGETEYYTSYLIDYPSDGLTITGVMQIPKGEGPFPVIVMNHGFFSRALYISGDGTDRASAFLSQYGYITIASDYRTWGDSDVGASLFYSGLVTDVINLINALPSIEKADPGRVGMWGHSMGGGVTMKVLTIDPRIRAGVLYSPVSADDLDVIDRWGPGCFGDIARGEQVIGCNSADVIPADLPLNLQTAYLNTASDEEALRRVAAYYHLDYVTAPVQIHYGMEDGKFLSGTPPEWSFKAAQGLRDAGKQVELYQYEGEGHSFIGEPWFVFMRRVLSFFDEHVK